MDSMQPGPVFRKARAVAFMTMTIFSLAWTALLCVVMYLKWNGSDFARSALLVILLCVNMVTCIMMPALLLVEFRLWLDAARFLFLVFTHFIPAIGFTVWTAKFHCQEGDDGKCDMLNTYIMIASWLNPALISAYIIGLSLAVYRWHKHTKSKELPGKFDIEEAKPKTPMTPAMVPPHSAQRSSFAALGPGSKHTSWRTSAPPLPSPRRSSLGGQAASSSKHLPWTEPTPPVPSIPRASFDAAASVKHVHLNISHPYSATTAPSVYSSQRGSFDVRAIGSKHSMSTRTSVPPSPRRGSAGTHSSSLRSSMKAPRPSLSLSTLPPPLPSTSVATLDYFDSPTSVSSGDSRSRSSARLSKPVPSKYF